MSDAELSRAGVWLTTPDLSSEGLFPYLSLIESYTLRWHSSSISYRAQLALGTVVDIGLRGPQIQWQRRQSEREVTVTTPVNQDGMRVNLIPEQPVAHSHHYPILDHRILEATAALLKEYGYVEELEFEHRPYGATSSYYADIKPGGLMLPEAGMRVYYPYALFVSAAVKLARSVFLYRLQPQPFLLPKSRRPRQTAAPR